jgi:hypothetical protein
MSSRRRSEMPRWIRRSRRPWKLQKIQRSHKFPCARKVSKTDEMQPIFVSSEEMKILKEYEFNKFAYFCRNVKKDDPLLKVIFHCILDKRCPVLGKEKRRGDPPLIQVRPELMARV